MFRRILVPEDIANPAERPLALAAEIGAATGATVTLLSVIDDSFPNPDILSFQMPWADYYRHLREEADRRLAAMCAKLGATAEVVVVRGKPAAAIVEFAATEHCDLIVMATHSGGALRPMIGSVTRRVIHEAPCPVMVTRLDEEEQG